jgi:hypothetical protein
MPEVDTGTVQYSAGKFVFCVCIDLGAAVVIRDLVSKWVMLILCVFIPQSGYVFVFIVSVKHSFFV